MRKTTASSVCVVCICLLRTIHRWASLCVDNSFNRWYWTLSRTSLFAFLWEHAKKLFLLVKPIRNWLTGLPLKCFPFIALFVHYCAILLPLFIRECCSTVLHSFALLTTKKTISDVKEILLLQMWTSRLGGRTGTTIIHRRSTATAVCIKCQPYLEKFMSNYQKRGKLSWPLWKRLGILTIHSKLVLFWNAKYFRLWNIHNGILCYTCLMNLLCRVDDFENFIIGTHTG